MNITVGTTGRLDAVLATTEYSRAQVQKWIKEGLVTVNGEMVSKPSTTVNEGDDIAVAIPDEVEVSEHIEPIDQQLSVLYEDDACLVLNKPAGISVHPGHAMDPHEHTLLNGVAYLFQQRSLPFSAGSVLVHRLDKDTTGCIVIAKTPEAHSALQKQFADRTTEKQYLALVAGVPKEPKAMIDAPIGRNLTDRTKMSALRTSVSREAQTTYEILDNSHDASLLLCDLHTGRTHQVRVHLSSIGHPILGDTTYKSGESESLTKQLAVASLCLHAWRLTFTSPATTQKQTVSAPLPTVLVEAIQSAQLTLPTE